MSISDSSCSRRVPLKAARAEFRSRINRLRPLAIAVLAASMGSACHESSAAAIDPSGKYTAGQSTGSFRVVAKTGTLADTSEVTLTSAPTPAPPPPLAAGTALRGCPEGGYTRLVNVSSEAQLGAALSSAQPGDQIRLAAGTYSGARSWSRSGTATLPITLCGLAGAGPVIKGGMFSSSGSYLVFTGLIFEGAATVERRNNVYLNNAHHLTFTGNEIRGGHYHAGLSTDEVHDVTITHNYIHGNGHDTSHDHGIYFKTTTGAGNLIANNLLVGNAARGLSIHDNRGAGVFDVLVTHNTIVGNGSTGVLVNDADRITVINNISAYNGDKTGQDQIRISAGNSNQVRNNLTYSLTSARAGIENTTASPASGNVVGQPRFVSCPTNLHLQVDSPALGLGLQAWTQSRDYDGVARGNPPTAGAYER